MNIELRSYEQSTMILGVIHIIIMCTQNPKMLNPSTTIIYSHFIKVENRKNRYCLGKCDFCICYTVFHALSKYVYIVHVFKIICG